MKHTVSLFPLLLATLIISNYFRTSLTNQDLNLGSSPLSQLKWIGINSRYKMKYNVHVEFSCFRKPIRSNSETNDVAVL